MFNSITADGLIVGSVVLSSVISIVLGLVIASVYTRTSRYTQNFAVTLVVLPILVQAVMMMVNGNLGTGVAILGAFSLVRFRSIPGTSREILYVFFAMSIGLATGTGFVVFAAVFAAMVGVLLMALHYTNMFAENDSLQTLKVTIPEDVDHVEAFEPLFEKHGIEPRLDKIKTKNMGSLFELTYEVELPESTDRKKLIDDLRVRNGNLAIVLFETKLEKGL